MTQEEKELLLQDLCARLPYRVMCDRFGGAREVVGINITDSKRNIIVSLSNGDYMPSEYYIEEIKPYLRPMESMTEEEREELSNYLCERVMSNKIGITIPPNPTQGKGIPFRWMDDCINWLDKKMFDYRGLIPIGIALPAKEGMYN